MKWWISNRRFINFAHKSDCCLFLWILWIGKSCALPFCPANRNRKENNETETFTKKCAEIPWWLQCRNWGPNLILSAAFKPCLGKYLGQFGTVWMHKSATKKNWRPECNSRQNYKKYYNFITWIAQRQHHLSTSLLLRYHNAHTRGSTAMFAEPLHVMPSWHMAALNTLVPILEHVGTFQKGQSLNHFSIKKRSKVVQHKCISRKNAHLLFIFYVSCQLLQIKLPSDSRLPVALIAPTNGGRPPTSPSGSRHVPPGAKSMKCSTWNNRHGHHSEFKIADRCQWKVDCSKPFTFQKQNLRINFEVYFVNINRATG